MKNLLLVCALLLFGSVAAQKTFVGIKAGGHTGSAFIDHTIFNVVNNAGLKGGFHTGLMVKYFPQKPSLRNTPSHLILL